MALLYVLDDGEDSGEIVRIRPNSFVIGRVDGNLTIPHDNGISGRHVELSRRFENGEHCWYLKDLQSTNGTFVRASTVTLSHEQELLIGSRRFRFDVPAAPSSRRRSNPKATRRASGNRSAAQRSISALQPSLVDISPGRPGRRFTLREPETLARPRSDPVLDRRR